MRDGSTYQVVAPAATTFTGAQIQKALNPPPAVQLSSLNLPRLQTAPSNLILPNQLPSADARAGTIGQADPITGGILGNGPALSFGGLLGGGQGGNSNPPDGASVGLVGGGLFPANPPANKWTQLSANTGQRAGSISGGNDGGMFVNPTAIQKAFSAPDNGAQLFEPKPTPFQQAATDQLTALGLDNGLRTNSPGINPANRATMAQPTPQPQATDDGEGMSTSDAGRRFIRGLDAQFPGTDQPYLNVQNDSEGNPTFGLGHRVAAGDRAAFNAHLATLDDAGRRALADELFDHDLAHAETTVANQLGADTVNGLAQHQYDALVADAFNAGTAGALGANMRQAIWDGDMGTAGRNFDAIWTRNQNHGGRREIAGGLIRRSIMEAQMFNNANYNYDPTEFEIVAMRAAHAGRR